MINTNLILRTLTSPFTAPFTDITKGSVLAQADVDNNFIYLKGNIIYSASVVNNTVTLQQINGNSISFFIAGGTGTSQVDVYVTGGTFNDTTGVATYTNNTGGTFTVTGFPTTDIYVTGGTYSNGIATFTNNTGGTFTVTGFTSGSSGFDVYVTGGTYSNGTAYFTNNSGVTFSVTGFTTGGTGDIYTNTASTPTTIGGIGAGSTFSAQTMQQMWDRLLYPYQSPNFTSFGFGYGSPQEVGFTIGTSQTFTWSTSNSQNVSPNTISINGYNLTTLTGLPNSGSEPVTFTAPVTSNSPDSQSWGISATNTESGGLSDSYSIRWDWRMYAGTSSNVDLTAGQITGLTNFTSVQNGFAGVYNMSAGGYKFFSFADAYGTPSTWVDNSNNLTVAMNFTVDGYYTNTDGEGNVYALVPITNQYGQTTNYRVYRTLYQLGGTISIRVS